MPKWKKESEQFRAAMKRGKEPDSVIVYKNKNMNQPMKRWNDDYISFHISNVGEMLLFN